MSLRVLIRWLVALVVLATLVLVARLATTEWRSASRVAEGLHAMALLREALVAGEMVSRERGPMNGLLGEPLPPRAERVEALREARARTDQAFDALGRALAAPGGDARTREVAAAFGDTRQALAQARGAIDALTARPRDGREAKAIVEAVQGMMRIVDRLAPAVVSFGYLAQRAVPQLSNELQGAILAAELREQAGRLGSHLTAALTRREPFDPEDRLRIARTQGRIDELRFLIELRLHGQSDAGVAQAWQAVEARYFGDANELLARVMATGEADGRFDLDAAGFAAAYVPAMNTLFAVRDGLLDAAQAHAAAQRGIAQGVLSLVSVSAALLLAILGCTIVMLHRRILAPLAQTTRVLEAMAANRTEPLPLAHANDEMGAVIGAVHTLQRQTEVAQALQRERDMLIERLREQLSTDFLTGALNRRAFFDAAERELARARRHGHEVIVVMLDVDHFKRFNDQHGHAAGDAALAAVADAVRGQLRKSDLLARFGGEEFVVLLSPCAPGDGPRLAERLREAIAAAAVTCPPGDERRVTASLGVADSAQLGLDLRELLGCADAAMYAAKRGGRDRVVLAPSSAPADAPDAAPAAEDQTLNRKCSTSPSFTT